MTQLTDAIKKFVQCRLKNSFVVSPFGATLLTLGTIRPFGVRNEAFRRFLFCSKCKETEKGVTGLSIATGVGSQSKELDS